MASSAARIQPMPASCRQREGSVLKCKIKIMKNRIFLKLPVVILCSLLSFITARSQLPSQMKAHVKASLDLIKVNNKGQSYINAKVLPRVVFNIKMDMMYKFSKNDYGPIILNSIPKTS